MKNNNYMKEINYRKKVQLLLAFILILWVGISFTRLVFNMVRIYGEEGMWLHYSDNQKKEQIYGDIYYVIQSINSYPSKKPVLLIAVDGKPYFISRYVLYPRIVHWDLLESNFLKNIKSYSLIINYHPEESVRNYNETFFKQISKNRRIIQIKRDKNIIALIYL